MPDLPPSSKRPPIVAAPRRAPAVRYAELHCKTNFSFLEGASHPDELVSRAAELGYAALAITDRHSLAGVVRAYEAAKEVGLKLLIGAEIWPSDAMPVVLWATDRASYARLSQLITRGCRRTEKGRCELTFDDLADHATDLLAGVLLAAALPLPLGEGRGEGKESSIIPFPSPHPNPLPQGEGIEHDFFRYREIFGDRCYALAELHCGPRDEELLAEWLAMSHRARVPLVAAGDVYYHRRSRLPLADVLTATRLGCTVAEAGDALFPNAERYLKDPDEMAPAIRRARRERSSEAANWPIERPSRSTSCVTNIRRNWPRRVKRRSIILRGSHGAARRSVIRPECPKKSAASLSTNWN